MPKLKNIKILTRDEQKALATKKDLSKKDFTIIYESYHSRIFNFVNARVSKIQDAEDITALVFEKVLKKLKDFQWQGITITSWIYRIARNAIIDFYRKDADEKTNSSVEEIGEFLVSDDEGLDNILIRDEEHVWLFKALKELDDEDQYLIYYRFYEELSNKEISELLGLSETNVGTRLHRLRSKLKGVVEGVRRENGTKVKKRKSRSKKNKK